MQESGHEISSDMTSQSEVAVSIVPATLVTSGYSTIPRFISADNVTYVYAAMTTEEETENQQEVTSSNSVESTFDAAQADHAYGEITQNMGNADSTVQVVKSSVESCRSPESINEQGWFRNSQGSLTISRFLSDIFKRFVEIV